jgi:hypothetical protein
MSPGTDAEVAAKLVAFSLESMARLMSHIACVCETFDQLSVFLPDA